MPLAATEEPVNEISPPNGRAWTLSELCRIGGLGLVRDAAVASLGFIDVPLDGRLVFAADEENLRRAAADEGIAAIVTQPRLAGWTAARSCGFAIAPDPRRAFAELHSRLAASTNFYGSPAASRVDPSAVVRPAAHIDEYDVHIGAGCRIESGAIVLAGTRLDRDVRVMSGAVLGAEGFQTMRFGSAVVDLPHVGGLEVGSRTVIMANAVIARAVFRQATRIAADCRIGNGAIVSHNNSLGARTLLGHGAIVAGNCRIGADVVFGPGAICIDRLSIDDRATVTAGAVVTKSVGADQRVSGNFAVDHRRFRTMMASFARSAGP